MYVVLSDNAVRPLPTIKELVLEIIILEQPPRMPDCPEQHTQFLHPPPTKALQEFIILLHSPPPITFLSLTSEN